MIVADTGPIIAFARLGRLGLLSDVVGVLIIPDAVYEALVGRGQERPGAAEVAQGTWIHRRTLTDSASIAQLPPALHRGEREAIFLAEEIKAQLLDSERQEDGSLIFVASRPEFDRVLGTGRTREAPWRTCTLPVDPFLKHCWGNSGV